MAAIAKAMTDEEIKAAAQVLRIDEGEPWIKVTEPHRAEDAYRGRLFVVCLAARPNRSACASRSAEDNPARRCAIPPLGGFVAYVPAGAIKKGETLVKMAVARHCVRDLSRRRLEGTGTGPGLAGRSPSYSARHVRHAGGCAQRNGADLMKPWWQS